MDSKLVASAGHYHLGHRQACWIALKKGWFAEDGIELDLRASGRDERSLVGLLNGEIDVILDLRTDKLLMARASGEDVYIIGGFRNTYPKQLFASKDVGSVAELRGRRIGIGEFGGISTRHHELLLAEHGLDYTKDVTFVRIGKEIHCVDALRKGDIDATNVGDHAEILLEEGFHSVADFNKQYPNGYQGRSLVITGKTARERPDTIKAFMKGYIRGNRFIMDPANGRSVLEYTYSMLEADRLRGGEWAEGAERDWPSCQKEDFTRFPVPVDGGISWEGFLLAMQDEKEAGTIPADLRAEDAVRLDLAKAAHQEVDARFGPGRYA